MYVIIFLLEENYNMGYRILLKTELCPNQYELVIEAPYIVRNAEAGQFIIFRAEENGESSERKTKTLMPVV